MLWGVGPGLKRGETVEQCNILDVASLLAHSVGVEIPAEYEGKFPAALYEEAYLAANPPKVSWNEVANKWIMTLATLDHITFYSSPDLKNWKEESEFGKEVGAHGGVWECPDLFSLNYGSKKLWVLIVNLNPGGPNGGSATQYFVGDFDGHQFKPFDNDTRWLDYGPDEYAGVLYSNTGNRRKFLGWMSNWLYGQQVPTEIGGVP